MLTLLSISACNKLSFQRGEEASTTIDTTYALSDASFFKIEIPYSTIDITTTGDQQAKLSIKKIVRAPSEQIAEVHLKDLKFECYPVGRGMRLQFKNPFITNVTFRVEIELQLPPEIDLRIETQGCKLFIKGFQNEISVNNVNGEIKLRDCRSLCKIYSMNAFIDVENTFPNESKNELKTSNGMIKLEMPVETSAYLSLNTDNGTMEVDEEFQIADLNRTAKNISGVLGTGAGSIKLTTFNAPIILKASK